MNIKKILWALVAICLVIAIAVVGLVQLNHGDLAPSLTDDSSQTGGASSGSVSSGTASVGETTISAMDYPTAATTGTAYTDAVDAAVTFNGGSAVVSGSGVTVDGSIVTITASGTYLLSGALTDGQLRVDTADTEKVKLILNGVSLHNSTGAPVYVINCSKKVILYLQEGSVNVVSDAAAYVTDETAEDNPTAAIYSKEDLKIDGTGALYVTGNCNKGIFTKDDLEIDGGQVYVTSADDAVRGKDSITITGGELHLDAGADGLRTSNEEEAEKGWIHISGGTCYISAECDAIQAITDCTITDGTFVIECGGGSANSSTTNSNWGNWGGNRGQLPNAGTSSATADTASAKGIKAGGTIAISGGSVSMDSSDDAIHSNNTVNISGGTMELASGDDGIHADSVLNISGGTINITKSYEGLEATDINISDGTVHLVSGDDGLNACGGSDNSAMGGRPGQNSFTSTTGEQPMITITGGRVVVSASGDGLDSNGSIDMSGGTVIVYGPEDNGNGAIDYGDGSSCGFTLSGGYLLAVGSSGMAQTATGNGQAVLSFTLGAVSRNTVLNIADSSGKSVLTFCSEKTYSSVVFSSADLKSGEKYTVSSGGTATGTIQDGIYTDGSYSGGNSLGSLTLN